MKNLFKTQSKLTKSILIAGLFALGCAAIGGQALAKEPTVANVSAEYVTYPVGYSDLDVSTTKGAKILYLRIRYAAQVLCESAATWGKKEGDACVRKAVDDAVARVTVPLLTQYYQQHSKGTNARQLVKVDSAVDSATDQRLAHNQPNSP